MGALDDRSIRQQTHRSLMIATVIRDTLCTLGLRYPPAKPELKGLRVS